MINANYYMNGKQKFKKRPKSYEGEGTEELEGQEESSSQLILNVADFMKGEESDLDPKISRTIFFDNEITEESATALRAQLMAFAAEDQETPIRLMLGSPGGGLWESFAIFDTIRMLPCPVIAICSGKVMSGGIIILLACETRVSTPNTTFMIHHGRTMISGNVIQLREQLNEIETLNERMLDMIIKETNITREQINVWLNKDYYLNAVTAEKHGLIQKTIYKLSELQ